MACLNLKLVNEIPLFDECSCVDFGQKNHESHVNASPFPHSIFDDFLPDEILEKVLEDFPEHKISKRSMKQENKKTGYNPDELESEFLRVLFQSFNSKAFLSFLESLTGIKGLLPDPYFLGGGLHETIRGGHLGVHADFNFHKKLHLKRRINTIIYLNKNWKEEYGGAIELWDTSMKNKVKEAYPVFNRAVIFNTNDTSYHGHPDPLTCPENMSRKSIALYYYTASERIYEEHKEHTTVFKKRSGSQDVEDYKNKTREWLKDITPPCLWRKISKIRKKGF